MFPSIDQMLDFASQVIAPWQQVLAEGTAGGTDPVQLYN